MTATAKKSGKKPDVYTIITERMLKALDAGTVPWQMPWEGGSVNWPRNLVSNKQYKGINSFLLRLAGYKSPYWLTYKQAQELGGNVRKGAESTMVVFWKVGTKEETDDAGNKTERNTFLLRYYRVFNLEQCENVKIPKGRITEDAKPNKPTPAQNAEACKAAEQVIADYVYRQPTLSLNHDGNGRAYYRPGTDSIHMPKQDSFHTPEHYLATLFHEAGHSTGHKSRLKRKGIINFDGFGSHQYAQEELVAEFTSAFLSGALDVDTAATFDNSASYLDNWRKALRNPNNKKWLVTAAAAAQKAADLILNVQPEKSGE
jgi:antirestriction protein ArdC